MGIYSELKDIAGKPAESKTYTQEQLDLMVVSMKRAFGENTPRYEKFKDTINAMVNSDIPELQDTVRILVEYTARAEKIRARPGAIFFRKDNITLMSGEYGCNVQHDNRLKTLTLVFGDEILNSPIETRMLRLVHEIKHCTDITEKPDMTGRQDAIDTELHAIASEFAAYIQLNQKQGYVHGGYDIFLYLALIEKKPIKDVMQILAELHVDFPAMDTQGMYSVVRNRLGLT